MPKTLRLPFLKREITGVDIPGLGWELSEETRKEIRDIEVAQMLARARLRGPIWFD